VDPAWSNALAEIICNDVTTKLPLMSLTGEELQRPANTKDGARLDFAVRSFGYVAKGQRRQQ